MFLLSGINLLLPRVTKQSWKWVCLPIDWVALDQILIYIATIYTYLYVPNDYCTVSKQEIFACQIILRMKL